MQQARVLRNARRIYSLDYSSRCSHRLFVTFNIATIVCDGINAPLEKEETEWECRWEEKKNLEF